LSYLDYSLIEHLNLAIAIAKSYDFEFQSIGIWQLSTAKLPDIWLSEYLPYL